VWWKNPSFSGRVTKGGNMAGVMVPLDVSLDQALAAGIIYAGMPVSHRRMVGQSQYFTGVIRSIPIHNGEQRQVVISVAGVDDYSTPHRFLQAAKSMVRHGDGSPIRSDYFTGVWVLFYDLSQAGRPKNWGQVRADTLAALP
jgi:hypothetical protein